MKKIALILLRIAISLGIVIFLMRRVNPPLMLKIIRGLDLKFLLWGFFILLVSYSLGVYRWKMLIGAMGLNPPISRIITATCGGLFFNTFLPSTIGGDVFRTMDLFSHTKQGSKILASVFLDRLSGFIGLMTIAFFSLLVGFRLINDKVIILSVAVLFCIFLLIFAIVFSRRIFKKIVSLAEFLKVREFSDRLYKFHTAIVELRANPRVLLYNLFISLLIQASGVFAFYFLGLSLHINLRIIHFLVVVPVIGAITVLPISIAGLGLRDSSTIIYLGRLGVAKEVAFSLSLLVFFLTTIIGILGGIIYVITLHNRRL